MDEAYFKKVVTLIILTVLVVLSYFLLKPILMAIIFGIVLSFVFSPVHDWLYQKTKSDNLSVILISIFMILLIILPIWFLTPPLIDQSLKIYFETQKIDFGNVLENFFPSFSSGEFSREVGSIISSFVNKTINSFVNYVSGFILNFPTILLQLGVSFLTFFFVLRDKHNLMSYLKSLMPFSKDVEDKIFEQTKGITVSILYGQVVMGLIQGLIAGAGFFIFSIPNALFLTILACIAGVLPIIGTTVIWVPVVIYLVITKASAFAIIGVTIFGLIAVFIDNILKPVFVSRRTSIPASIILFGMIGGFFLSGTLGFIVGPLILAYLVILLEIYRNKRVPGLLIQEPPSKLKISI